MTPFLYLGGDYTIFWVLAGTTPESIFEQIAKPCFNTEAQRHKEYTEKVFCCLYANLSPKPQNILCVTLCLCASVLIIVGGGQLPLLRFFDLFDLSLSSQLRFKDCLGIGRCIGVRYRLRRGWRGRGRRLR